MDSAKWATDKNVRELKIQTASPFFAKHLHRLDRTRYKHTMIS
jgi:hypothetical protein